MRESYHDELNATSGRILTMAELVRVAVKDATEALIGADLTTAERVISDDSKVDALNEEIERRCFDLLARSVRRDVEDRGFHDRESREDAGGS